jgi:hypothetical protein
VSDDTPQETTILQSVALMALDNEGNRIMLKRSEYEFRRLPDGRLQWVAHRSYRPFQPARV